MRRPLALKWGFPILLTLLFAGFSPAWAGQDVQEKEPASVADPAKQLRMFLFGRVHAPDFAMKDLSGKEVRLSDFRGKVVLINFWFTW